MRGIIVILVLFTALQTLAQESIPITLEKVLELSGAKNLTIQEYLQRQKLAVANLNKAKEWWLPNVNAGVQANQLWGAAMNGNGKFFLDVERNNLALGLGVQANWDFAQSIYDTKAAKLKSEASLYYSKAERSKVLLKSIQAYYDLMSAQFKLVAYKNLVTQSDEIINQIQIQVDAGLRYESEVLLAKSNKLHLKVEMLNAKKNYNLASSQLLELLNLGQEVKLVSVDSTLLPLDYTKGRFNDGQEPYLNRPEIKANRLEVQALEIKQKTYTTGLLIPTLNMGYYGSYFGSLNGNLTPIDPIAYPNTNQLYPTTTWNASLMWSIPLGAFVYDGDNKRYSSLIALKEIEAKQFESQINAEIAKATILLQTGKEQITISKEALDLTTEALNQSIERQKLGTAKSFEVFQAQQFSLQAQIDYLKAISEYNKAQFELKVAKGEEL
jgi:outer membrane protein TolC